ncbi:MAG: hypothetical protein ACR2PA_05005 [Hyphomicrobiaceae bacterium]
MTEQLTFDLPHRPAQDADDFLVSGSNQAAVELIDNWPGTWPNCAAAVCGPAGVGKSHLVHVWRSRSHAECITGTNLDVTATGILERCDALAVEDLDRGIGDEKALFHILNLAREERRSVLLTARVAPGELQVSLPDLRSRLRALRIAVIAPPDDALLRGLLVKLFSDRQLRVDPATITYILTHMERSAESAAKVVGEMDRLALKSHRRASRLLAREVIYKLF